MAEYDAVTIENANRIRSVGTEVVGGSGLEALLQNKPEVVAYDGFEPSGRMHIAQGLIRAINTNKMTESGVKFKFWVADWFATMNLKLGGDATAIRKAGELMIHTWRACGMDLSNVEFVWASEEIARRPAEYFSLILDIATKNSLKRVLKCGQIMGRKDFDEDGEAEDISVDDIVSSLKTSQVFYPVMQCADIFFLGVDICSLGLDQRKVNMLAIEYCDKIKRRFKPVIVSHAMLMGLDGSDKMSKSNPDSAIFMDDTVQEVNRKIKKAYCRPGDVEVNPILEYFKYIVFEKEVDPIKIDRKDYETKEIMVISYSTFEELVEAFRTEYIFPNDLKAALKSYLKKYMDPVREYFSQNPEAQKLSADVKRAQQKAARTKAKAKSQ
jgi:tyrosyl-tRNA synthetase